MPDAPSKVSCHQTSGNPMVPRKEGQKGRRGGSGQSAGLGMGARAGCTSRPGRMAMAGATPCAKLVLVLGVGAR